MLGKVFSKFQIQLRCSVELFVNHIDKHGMQISTTHISCAITKSFSIPPLPTTRIKQNYKFLLFLLQPVPGPDTSKERLSVVCCIWQPCDLLGNFPPLCHTHAAIKTWRKPLGNNDRGKEIGVSCRRRRTCWKGFGEADRIPPKNTHV